MRHWDHVASFPIPRRCRDTKCVPLAHSRDTFSAGHAWWQASISPSVHPRGSSDTAAAGSFWQLWRGPHPEQHLFTPPLPQTRL